MLDKRAADTESTPSYTRLAELRALLIIRTACDEQGNHLWSENDMAHVLALPVNLADKLYTTAARLNGMEIGDGIPVCAIDEHSVIVGQPRDEPIVNGKVKPRLTIARHHVIKALISAGENGLTGDELVVKSGHGGAVNILKDVARDPDWRAVIQLPGSSHGRYRIVYEFDRS